jgi:hypothetical protein
MGGIAISYLADGDDDTSLEGLEVVRGGSLESVLERIGAGEFSTLVLARLHAIAGSLRELIALLDWLEGVGARLVAIDVGLDTGSAAGRRTVAALREIARWEREPGPGRPPRGRPGLTVQAPELSGRIAGLREQGLSLQAIADALNAEGVPTPRGGTHWRPSSVQAALGYRRPPPRPPLPPPGPSALRGPGNPKPPSGPGRRGPQPGPSVPRGPGHPGGRPHRRPRKGDGL